MKVATALLIASLLSAPLAAGTFASGTLEPSASTLERVYALAGEAPSPASLNAVASLPDATRAQLDAVFLAFLDYHATAQAITATYGSVDPYTIPDLWAALEPQQQTLQAASLALASAPSAPVAAGGFEPGSAIQLELACDSQPNDTYTMDAILIVDLCGNDTYLNNAGGTVNVAPGPTRCDRVTVAPNVHVAATLSAAVIDLDGNDQYTPTDASCGVNGGGALGAGFLLDAEGDDAYAAGAVATNGGGHLGSGFLFDAAGNDTYTADDQGVNGGAYVLGRGILIDVQGDDAYAVTPLATRGVNGGGYFASVGFLADLETLESFNDGEAFVCSGNICRMAVNTPLADSYGVRINTP